MPSSRSCWRCGRPCRPARGTSCAPRPRPSPSRRRSAARPARRPSRSTRPRDGDLVGQPLELVVAGVDVDVRVERGRGRRRRTSTPSTSAAAVRSSIVSRSIGGSESGPLPTTPATWRCAVSGNCSWTRIPPCKTLRVRARPAAQAGASCAAGRERATTNFDHSRRRRAAKLHSAQQNRRLRKQGPHKRTLLPEANRRRTPFRPTTLPPRSPRRSTK